MLPTVGCQVPPEPVGEVHPTELFARLRQEQQEAELGPGEVQGTSSYIPRKMYLITWVTMTTVPIFCKDSLVWLYPEYGSGRWIYFNRQDRVRVQDGGFVRGLGIPKIWMVKHVAVDLAHSCNCYTSWAGGRHMDNSLPGVTLEMIFIQFTYNIYMLLRFQKIFDMAMELSEGFRNIYNTSSLLSYIPMPHKSIPIWLSLVDSMNLHHTVLQPPRPLTSGWRSCAGEGNHQTER